LFDLAPVIGIYLKTHLLGDIFARDNVDWSSRVLAMLDILVALPELQAHMRINLDTGLTLQQLQQVAQMLGQQVDAAAGAQVQAAWKAVLHPQASSSC
jgi:4-carboxymuconolactone decarboxylase